VEWAQEWIWWVLAALIGSQQSPSWLPKTAGRVWLLDASRLKLPAGSGEDVKVQSASNLGLGRLEDVKVSERHSAEVLHHVALRPRYVAVTEAGSQLGASVQQGQAQAASGVHRFSYHQVRLEREDGQKIDLKRLLKHHKYGTVREYKVWVCDPSHRERFAIGLVIWRLPHQQARQARARKQARIGLKKGPKANLAPAWWAGVMLLGTSLPQEQRSSQDVVKL